MIFYYIRHAQPIYNPDVLTELGEKQAEALAKRLALYGLDEIYASTSGRAIQTAEPIAKILGKEIIPCPWAHESLAGKDFVALNEKGKNEWIFTNPLFHEKLRAPEVEALGEKWYEHPYFADCPNLKSGTERVNRETDSFFLGLGLRHDRDKHYYVKQGRETPDKVALFAHGGFGSAFLSSLLDIPYPILAKTFAIAHTGVTVIDFDTRKEPIVPLVLQFSALEHLYKDDLMTGYNSQERLKI